MKNRMNTKKALLQVRMPHKLKIQLELFASVKQVTMSDCVRVAVEMFLNDENHYKQMTVNEFMRGEEV